MVAFPSECRKREAKQEPFFNHRYKNSLRKVSEAAGAQPKVASNVFLFCSRNSHNGSLNTSSIMPLFAI